MSNEKEILGLEDKRFAAMVARDFAGLEKLVHEDLLYTHSSGITDTKASWLESMKSGKVKYKGANCSERQVRFFGNVALVRGKAAIVADIGGQPRSLQLLDRVEALEAGEAPRDLGLGPVFELPFDLP